MATEHIIQALFGLLFAGQFSLMVNRMGAISKFMEQTEKETDKSRERLHEHSNRLQEHEGRLTNLEDKQQAAP